MRKLYYLLVGILVIPLFVFAIGCDGENYATTTATTTTIGCDGLRAEFAIFNYEDPAEPLWTKMITTATTTAMTGSEEQKGSGETGVLPDWPSQFSASVAYYKRADAYKRTLIAATNARYHLKGSGEETGVLPIRPSTSAGWSYLGDACLTGRDERFVAGYSDLLRRPMRC